MTSTTPVLDDRPGVEPAVDVRGLRQTRGTFDLDVDLTVPAGLVSGIVGPNGAGKSTTLRSILGLTPHREGTVRLLGEEVGPDVTTVRQVGVVLDHPLLSPHWRVRSAAARVGRFHRTWDGSLLEELLTRFSVPTGVRVGELSRGQSVGLSIALALAHRPRLLVLDEPTSGLDPAARAEFADVVRAFMAEEGRTVLFSTHITTDLDHLADVLHVIAAGRVVWSGPLEEVREEFAVVRGPGVPDDRVQAALIGARRGPHGYEGLIRTSDTAVLHPDAVLETATTDELVAHLAALPPRRPEVSR